MISGVGSASSMASPTSTDHIIRFAGNRLSMLSGNPGETILAAKELPAVRQKN